MFSSTTHLMSRFHEHGTSGNFRDRYLSALNTKPNKLGCGGRFRDKNSIQTLVRRRGIFEIGKESSKPESASGHRDEQRDDKRLPGGRAPTHASRSRKRFSRPFTTSPVFRLYCCFSCPRCHLAQCPFLPPGYCWNGDQSPGCHLSSGQWQNFRV